MTPCGCRIELDEGKQTTLSLRTGITVQVHIVYCPLHQATWAMREALQANRAVHAHLCTDCIPGSDGVCLTYSALRLKALELTKQALVASEGKET